MGNVTALSTEGDARIAEGGRNKREASRGLNGTDAMSPMGLKTLKYPQKQQKLQMPGSTYQPDLWQTK